MILFLLDILFSRKYSCLCLINLLVIIKQLQATTHVLNDSLSSVELGDDCESLLERYATITANFTRCVIRHARPIMICQKCIHELIAVEKSHEDILKLHENSGQVCQKVLVNVDRLDLIETSFVFVKNQWEQASCDKCFVSGHNSTVVNKNTIDIFKLRNETAICLEKAVLRNSTTICDDCRGNYSSLNNFYELHGSHRGFCMDVIDMVNATRYEWGKKYNCSTTRNKPELIFFTSSIITCMLPVIFYFTIWIYSTFSFPEISTQSRWNRRFRRLSTSS